MQHHHGWMEDWGDGRDVIGRQGIRLIGWPAGHPTDTAGEIRAREQTGRPLSPTQRFSRLQSAPPPGGFQIWICMCLGVSMAHCVRPEMR